MSDRFVSTHFPFFLIMVSVQEVTTSFEALLDTGFDGDIIVPISFSQLAGSPHGFEWFELADGSLIRRPVYFGRVDLSPLGSFPVVIAALADESLVGRGFSDRFMIILDHGQRIIVEP